MRVTTSDDRIELRRAPGCLWAFGLWFVAGGALAFAMVAFRSGDLAAWERAVGAFIGLGVLGGGLYHMSTTPATSLSFDLRTGRVRYERRAPLRHRVVVDVPAHALLGCSYVASKDSDGDDWLELNVLFDGHAPLLLDSASGNAREYLQGVEAAVNEARNTVLGAGT